ncbi:MAG: GntR family transcriptional regulator [Humibacillus sp.]|nr:GntR family transcriptional regulator [Humibacillus sp.]MDN5775787.1 GntR family transcriptional regulator [Humibacillus sp.]
MAISATTSRHTTGRNETVLQHRSLPESVHDILRSRILSNELPAGTPLVELNLAAEFGVSRTTVRAALRELQTERLIEVQPRRRTIVSRMSAEDVAEACYTRFVLESASLPDVWEVVRPGLLAEMSDVVDLMQLAADTEDVSGIVELDTALHRLIMESSGHPRLVELWSTLNGQMGALMRSTLDRQGLSLDETVAMHRKLLTSFRRKDPTVAVAALRDHYVGSTHA